MILYLDANAIIYAIEGIPGLRRVPLRWIEEAEVSPESVMVTSRLSMLECRVKPLREGDHAGVGRIDGFFQRREARSRGRERIRHRASDRASSGTRLPHS
jgi:hypothetical protein